MGEQGERDHLSIGEVLSLLKEEFPDVTISKIRFLESQGLLDPERTPSGYRKFYEPDVERLRWILRQQKENFLPLKVIRGRLGVDESGGGAAGAEAALEASPHLEPPAALEASVPQPDMPDLRQPETRRTRTVAKSESRVSPTVSLVPPPRSRSEESMTLHELCEFTGLAPERVRELERFGLLAGKAVAGATYYDGDAIDVARIAAAFEAHGMEPRHLKMYKSTAERETTLFEQVVTPLLKQRNPRSRRQAADTLTELVNLAHELRNILVKRAVDEMGLG
ncbi:MAG TPA: MerR family transcriptional regulator [Acidimicrobiales bacterium]|nr:MerR family transcriptional regulator [Acidimicrobiales bacterium]